MADNTPTLHHLNVSPSILQLFPTNLTYLEFTIPEDIVATRRTRYRIQPRSTWKDLFNRSQTSISVSSGPSCGRTLWTGSYPYHRAGRRKSIYYRIQRHCYIFDPQVRYRRQIRAKRRGLDSWWGVDITYRRLRQKYVRDIDGWIRIHQR